MSDYVIITDTSADIPADILDKGQIHLIPMVYQLNGEECPHRNPGNWDSRAFYDKLRAGGTRTTSQISPATYTDCFEPFLKEGKDILYISLSGGLTSTWQSSRIAAADLMEEYPERKISCVDSLAATGGQESGDPGRKIRIRECPWRRIRHGWRRIASTSVIGLQ